MSRKTLLAVVCSFISIQLNAQDFVVSKDSIKYGTLFKNLSSTTTLVISNNSPYSLKDVSIRTTNKDFKVSDTLIDLAPKTSKTIQVTFSPRHNITYNEKVIISSNSPYGTIVSHLNGTGFYTGSAYNATQDKWEGDLLTVLRTITTQGHNTNIGYTSARDQMYGFIDNQNGDITCVYTGRVATFNTRAGAVSNSFNAEHTFPRSQYNSQNPMFSDIHHLYPADATANTQRSNDPFGVVTSPVWMQGGSISDNSTFEPRDEHKGTAARAMIYFVTRYQDHSGFFNPQEDILRKWALAFKPTSWDSLRNERTFLVQGNRNPYIDHPEFIERISNFAGAGPPQIKSISTTYIQPVNYGYVALNDTIDYGLLVENTGNTEVDIVMASLTPKPQPNVITQQGLFKIQPRESKYFTFRFIARNSGMNFTDSFSLQVQGGAQNILAFTANVSGLSVREQQRANIKLYPNPTANTVLINADKVLNYPCEVNFYNIAGRLVHSTVLNETFTELNIASLSAGCYFVQVNDGNLSSVTKLVKY
jgi:hypothetical protein